MNKELLPKAEAFFETHQDVRGFFYMTLGNEGGAMLANASGHPNTGVYCGNVERITKKMSEM